MFKKSLIVLFLILCLGIFLRSLNFKETFIFAHDGDLGAWIVKDIVFDKHPRLIGQETSAPGVFIGPLYYYALIPFYFFTNWEAIGGMYFALLVAGLTIASVYFVFGKLFGRETGIIAALLQATLCAIVSNDRWVVPTITTNLWTVWFFFCLVGVLNGKFNLLIPLGILAGLIWHINFTLAPLYLLVLVAIYLSKKVPSFGQTVGGVVAFLISSIPFFIFEFRHNFSQTLTILTYSDTGVETSILDRLNLIFLKVAGNISSLFFYPYRSSGELNIASFLAVMLGIYFIYKRGLIKKNLLIIFYSWIGIMFLTFAFLKKAISEYYFDNLNLVFLTVLIFLLIDAIKIKGIGKIIVFIIFVLVFSRTAFYFYTNQNYDSKGYMNRKEIVNHIKTEKEKNNFPCISVSYLTQPGDNVGFRYLFFLNNMHVNQPNSESPNYTIVIPPGLSTDSVKYISGAFGVIPPDKKYTKEQIDKSCSGQNSNLTDPMMGFYQ